MEEASTRDTDMAYEQASHRTRVALVVGAIVCLFLLVVAVVVGAVLWNAYSSPDESGQLEVPAQQLPSTQP